MPVGQITGSVDFYERNFYITGDVLVPRPETEFLVELALEEVKRKELKEKSGLKILDVGSGSGAIIVTLVSELDSDQKQIANSFFASDISLRALSVAKKNAKALGVASKIEFFQADLFEPMANSKQQKAKYDIITANLPYIPHEEMNTLAFDVMHYEPRIALDGGSQGLEIYEEFFRQLPDHLSKGGMVFCEIGHNQGEPIKKIIKRYLPKAKLKILKDLADIDRIAVIKN